MACSGISGAGVPVSVVRPAVRAVGARTRVAGASGKGAPRPQYTDALVASAQAERFGATVRRHAYAAETICRGEAGLDQVPGSRLGPELTAACGRYGTLMASGDVAAASRVLDTLRSGAADLRERRVEAQLDELAERAKGRDYVTVARARRFVRDRHQVQRDRVAAVMPGRIR